MQAPAQHLRWILGITALLWLAVIGINGVAFFTIAAPENQRILQNNVGWERTYKPMIHDRLQPAVAVFGASWARDAFDYEETTALLGRPFFNHAVSGGQPYENRRFLQSALAANPQLQVVLLNLNSFERYPKQLKFQYGFNESLLNLDAEGERNAQVAWHRFFAATLSGAAVGNNLSAFGLLRQFRDGVPKEELLRAYDRHDLAANPRHARWARMLAGAPSDEGTPEPFDATAFPVRFEELGRAVRLACARGATVKTYWTPSHPLLVPHVPSQQALKSAMLEFLRSLQPQCAQGLAYWDFAYPNAMTLEGLGGPDGRGLARYFREDGHPRPTAGQVMTAQMFGRPFFSAPLRDLGTDLLALPPAEAKRWIAVREARWRGQWRPDEREAVLQDQMTMRKHGAVTAP
jgi:hypothetical protein